MTDQPKPPEWGPLPKFGDNLTEEEWAEINLRSDLEAERAAVASLEAKLKECDQSLVEEKRQREKAEKERDEWKQHAATGVALREKELAEAEQLRAKLEMAREALGYAKDGLEFIHDDDCGVCTPNQPWRCGPALTIQKITKALAAIDSTNVPPAK